VFDQDAPNGIPINLNTEVFRDNQGDAGATETRVPAFKLDYGLDERLGWTFRSGLCSFLWREQSTVFAAHEALVEIQQG
jgi:hypothetical protein